VPELWVEGLKFEPVAAVVNLVKLMAYFPDLAPYAYGRGLHPGVVHVGWLDKIHPFPQGSVDTRLIEKIKQLAAKPVELYRGKHLCELCAAPPDVVKTLSPTSGIVNSAWSEWAAQRSGNGEIRVSRGGVTFAAPVLVVHYVETHGYLPPAQFMKAVEEHACT
jgi:hypothetical protein